MTGERTYRREDFLEARRRWDEGGFGQAWAPYRKLAGEHGFIFPPEGSRWDSWEDAEPSQRAIVYRAIEDTPALLREAIARSRSWGQVVAALIRAIERLRDDADLAERDAAWERDHGPDPREATTAIKRILDRIGAS